MLSCKAFATNSLKWKFLLDVWFGRDCVSCNIEHLSNINEIVLWWNQRIRMKKKYKIMMFKKESNVTFHSDFWLGSKKIDDIISMLHMNCNPNLNYGWLLFDENVGILKTGIQNAVIIFTPYAYRWDVIHTRASAHRF